MFGAIEPCLQENNTFNVVFSAIIQHEFRCCLSSSLSTASLRVISPAILSTGNLAMAVSRWHWRCPPPSADDGVTRRIFCLIATNFIFLSPLSPSHTLGSHSCHQRHVLLFFSHDSFSIATNLPTIFAFHIETRSLSGASSLK